LHLYSLLSLQFVATCFLTHFCIGFFELLHLAGETFEVRFTLFRFVEVDLLGELLLISASLVDVRGKSEGDCSDDGGDSLLIHI